MINLKLEDVNGSMILRIQAAVLEAMESVNFHPDSISTELSSAKTDGHWMMVFVKDKVTSEEMNNVIRELGGKFLFTVLGGGKKNLFLQLEGLSDDFILLLKKSQQIIPSRRELDSQAHA